MKKNVLLILCIVAVAFISKGQTTQLWGMTSSGGTYNDGTIFKINPDGTGFVNLYNLVHGDGHSPYGYLIQASNGNIYSTTWGGGNNYNGGTIFKFNPVNNFYVDEFDFDFLLTGNHPYSGVVEAQSGMLYGVTTSGISCPGGTIYSYNPITNSHSDLFSFDSVSGFNAYRVPILGNNKLFGMTGLAGVLDYGVIYSFDIITNYYSVLYNFDGLMNGGLPYSSPLLLDNGKLYGTTSIGGVNGVGVLFSYDTLTNFFQKLYDFDNINGQGFGGSLMQAANHKLYGVSHSGGTFGKGVIYSFDLAIGSYTNLYNFDSITGSNPQSSLIQLSNGILYGTTSKGGALGCGVVFSFDLTTNAYTDLFDFNGTNGLIPQCGLLAVTTSVGISDFKSSDDSISIYPNPATYKLNISINDANFNSAEIKINNILGEKILQTAITNHQSTIDISALSKGMYFAETIVDGKRSVMKIIKE